MSSSSEVPHLEGENTWAFQTVNTHSRKPWGLGIERVVQIEVMLIFVHSLLFADPGTCMESTG